jgi:Domain of unknown function (DUF4261)
LAERKFTKMSCQMKKSRDCPVEGVVMHHVLEDGWVHTHGMRAFGKPELEIRNAPPLFLEAAVNILREACSYLKEPGVVVKVGETMELSSSTAFRFVKPEPLTGNEDITRYKGRKSLKSSARAPSVIPFRQKSSAAINLWKFPHYQECSIGRRLRK